MRHALLLAALVCFGLAGYFYTKQPPSSSNTPISIEHPSAAPAQSAVRATPAAKQKPFDNCPRRQVSKNRWDVVVNRKCNKPLRIGPNKKVHVTTEDTSEQFCVVYNGDFIRSYGGRHLFATGRLSNRCIELDSGKGGDLYLLFDKGWAITLIVEVN
jgi:hypothetical protein